MEVPDFILKAWASQRGKYVFVSYKHQGEWKDVALNGNRSKILDKLRVPSGADLYFCFNSFQQPRRLEAAFEDSEYFYADLDEVDPRTLALRPTAAWQTSPGKYQCMWQCRTKLDTENHKRINQRLTYLTGADKGGWSVTKALRIPGTYNYKYGKPKKVKLLWDDGPIFSVKTLVAAVRSVRVTGSVENLADLGLPEVTASSVLRTHRKKLSQRSLELLRAPKAIVGERSDRLWELECLLLNEGISPEETLILIRDTVWNKYAGQAREVSQLWKEVQKAKEHVDEEDDPIKALPGRRLRFDTLDEFMAREVPTERWTVEGIWSYDSHGVIAGEPKTFKSFISTELGVAVASGRPFLGRFEIPHRGPVWIIQEENTAQMMQDRLHKITMARGCGGAKDGELVIPETLPIKLMSEQGFNLKDDEHIEFLESTLQRARQAKETPKLLILDPLYMMVPGMNESDQKEVAEILGRLLKLKHEFGVGILIVHHYRKPKTDEDTAPGHRIAGSGVFYRWFQDALYLSKGREPGQVRMDLEHRGHAPTTGIFMEFDIGEMGENEYFVDVEVRKSDTGELRRTLKELLEAEKGNGVRLGDAADLLGVSKDRVRTLIERMGYTLMQSQADGTRGRPALMIVKKR